MPQHNQLLTVWIIDMAIGQPSHPHSPNPQTVGRAPGTIALSLAVKPLV
ncbi:MAG TPA: hypothetical protein VGS08_03480 [Candidatus Saccharimonadales bacterium]|nr:hypothetical protein [Candidatus Saccharimonadales bacterium]